METFPSVCLLLLVGCVARNRSSVSNWYFVKHHARQEFTSSFITTYYNNDFISPVYGTDSRHLESWFVGGEFIEKIIMLLGLGELC